jgi:ABC-type transport system involved in multi-copper enzyme maturation permease subunit
MFWNLYSNENDKLFRRAMYWAGLAILLGTTLALFGLFFAVVKFPSLSQNLPPEQVAQLKATLTWPASCYTALQLSGTTIGVGGLLALVLVGVVAAQEYPWRTLNLAIGHGTSRSRILAAKLLSIFTALTGWMAILMLAVGAVTAFTTGSLGGTLDFGSVNFLHLGLSILRTVFALAPYVALAFCLAIATRSMVAAIGVVAGFSLIVEPLFMQMLGLMGGGMARISAFLPMMLASSLLGANDPSGNFIHGAMSPETAAAGIAAYAAVFLLLAFQIFRRQDLTS